jgi:heme/copper-type cytochrome/quinol oxidase subunit 4
VNGEVNLELALSKTSNEQQETEGLGWRVTVSIITVFGLAISLILWLFFYASGYNAYQNIAVVIVMILAFVGIMGATWASWGMKQSERNWEHTEERRA